ncbi:glycosyltransferase, partial [Flavobacteriaceae bacterium]|nr:glycosyltransferase [Flavobacteriaceae bacterium]
MEALDGFLMQKVDFDYEILLRDDASTDGTSKICHKYANKYPDKIKLLAYTENQYQKGVSPFRDNVKRAKGKYIAMCEGDDYWTDPYKLQKQVNFLENNEDFSFCFHRVYNSIEGKVRKNILSGPKATIINSEFQVTDLIKEGGSFVPICSLVYRNNFENKFPQWFHDCSVGDLPLVLYLSNIGKIGFLEDVMSVYRVASNIDS